MQVRTRQGSGVYARSAGLLRPQRSRLRSDSAEPLRRIRPSLELVCKSLALHELKHEESHAVCIFEIMNRCDIRMIQCGQHLGFSLEARYAITVAGGPIANGRRKSDCSSAIEAARGTCAENSAIAKRARCDAAEGSALIEVAAQSPGQLHFAGDASCD